jgi:hypothetical protein
MMLLDKVESTLKSGEKDMFKDYISRISNARC